MKITPPAEIIDGCDVEMEDWDLTPVSSPARNLRASDYGCGKAVTGS